MVFTTPPHPQERRWPEIVRKVFCPKCLHQSGPLPGHHIANFACKLTGHWVFSTTSLLKTPSIQVHLEVITMMAVITPSGRFELCACPLVFTIPVKPSQRFIVEVLHNLDFWNASLNNVLSACAVEAEHE
jgi:hypothetical protein